MICAVASASASDADAEAEAEAEAEGEADTGVGEVENAGADASGAVIGTRAFEDSCMSSCVLLMVLLPLATRGRCSGRGARVSIETGRGLDGVEKDDTDDEDGRVIAAFMFVNPNSLLV